MRLSIIIPHYNSARTLEKLLTSIPQEEQIQVIVVDDGSTEEQKQELTAVMNRAAERLPHLEVYLNHAQKGAGPARNEGLAHAQGEWLLFADADDYFLADLWEKILPYLEGEADLVFFPPTSADAEKGELSDRHLLYEKLVFQYLRAPGGERELELRCRFVSPCSKLVRRSMTVKGGIGFENVPAANDVMFSVRCGVAAEKITASEQVLYCITKSRTSLTGQKSLEQDRVRVEVFLRMYRFLRENLQAGQMKKLDLCGFGYLSSLRKDGAGPKELWRTGQRIRREGIPVITPKLLKELLR